MKQGGDGIFVCYKKYDENLLKRSNMSNCEVETTLMNIIEKL